MRRFKSVEPIYKKIANKFKNQVELPEIQERMQKLREMSRDVYHRKPSWEELRIHSKNFMIQRKQRLDYTTSKRAE